MKTRRSILRMAAALSVLAVGTSPALAQIPSAKVTGGEIKGAVNNGLSIFKGIPFAAPPVGDLRWKAPQPVIPWTGVKDAIAFGPAPMQSGNNRASEDCLYLNVWTPAKTPADKLPVMVWIYGGGFTAGSTGDRAFDGVRLAHKGVLLVSVAYRLGAFGFLAHPELSKESGQGSGCFGIQDQIAGLQWVHDNIAQFGGDPNRVTIFGESAGGISVSMLTVAPAAKGLFQGAISESGGSMAPDMFGGEAGENVPTLALAEQNGKAFLQRLGVADIKAARALPASAIQSAASGGARFWPVADGHTVPGDQYELFSAGKFNDTPILVGTNSDEGASFARGTAPTAATFEQQARDRYGPAADAILAAYPHATDAQAAQSSKDLFRESAFAWHTWAWASLQTQKGKSKAYVYYFQYHTGSSNGATHGSEVGFVFGTHSSARPEEAALSNQIMTYWTNFAKNGDPNGPDLPLWPVFDGKSPQAMALDTTSAAKDLPNLDKIKAFDAYYAWRRAEAKKKSAPN